MRQRKKKHIHNYEIKHNLDNSTLCPQITFAAGKGQIFKYQCDIGYLSRTAKTL